MKITTHDRTQNFWKTGSNKKVNIISSTMPRSKMHYNLYLRPPWDKMTRAMVSKSITSRCVQKAWQVIPIFTRSCLSTKKHTDWTNAIVNWTLI